MTPVTHIASGLALATIFNKVGVIHIDIVPLWYSPLWVAIIALVSVLPDINVLWSSLTKHHDDFTHYPLFWLLVSILLGIAEYFYLGSTELSLLFAGLIFLHLLLDTVGHALGLKWFSPLSSKEFSFTRIQSREVLALPFFDKGKLYIKSPAARIEFGVLIVSMLTCVFVR